MSKKKSEPQVNFGHAKRDIGRKLGMFASTMSKQPTKIRIEHPKIY